MEGNIFASRAEVIVITVNCVGVMGAGIALDAKHRWPDIDAAYVVECAAGRISIGQILWAHSGKQLIALFPTKTHWKLPSKISYLEAGLVTLREAIVHRSIKSLALPHLGCSNGGLDWEDVHPLIVEKLRDIPDLEIELWDFKPNFVDPDFMRFHETFLALDETSASKWLKCSKRTGKKLREIFQGSNVTNFTQLSAISGIGEKTVDRVYQAALRSSFPSVQTVLGYD